MAAITAASSVHMMTVDGERGMRGAGGRVPHRRGVRKSESVSHDSFPVELCHETVFGLFLNGRLLVPNLVDLVLL